MADASFINHQHLKELFDNTILPYLRHSQPGDGIFVRKIRTAIQSVLGKLEKGQGVSSLDVVVAVINSLAGTTRSRPSPIAFGRMKAEGSKLFQVLAQPGGYAFLLDVYCLFPVDPDSGSNRMAREKQLVSLFQVNRLPIPDAASKEAIALESAPKNVQKQAMTQNQAPSVPGDVNHSKTSGKAIQKRTNQAKGKAAQNRGVSPHNAGAKNKPSSTRHIGTQTECAATLDVSSGLAPNNIVALQLYLTISNLHHDTSTDQSDTTENQVQRLRQQVQQQEEQVKIAEKALAVAKQKLEATREELIATENELWILG